MNGWMGKVRALRRWEARVRTVRRWEARVRAMKRQEMLECEGSVGLAVCLSIPQD